MSLSDQVQAYVVTLTLYVALDDIFGAVDALIARDSTSRWWELDQ